MTDAKPSGEERKTMGGNEMSAEELQDRWFRVEVSDRDGQVVAIESKMLAGRGIGDAEEETINQAIDHLSGFIGRTRELAQAKAALAQANADWAAAEGRANQLFGELNKAKAELSALSRASGEAVAWRIETKMKSGAILTEVTDIPEHQVSARKMGCTIIPLFAAPTAPGMCLDEITSEMENAGMKEAKYQYNLPVTRASVCAIFKAMLSAAAKGRAAT